MTFHWFRKHEKMFLWGTVAFAVIILATFSGFGELKTLLQHSSRQQASGEFVVQSTGETMAVSAETFQRMRTDLNRLAFGRHDKVTDEAVWSTIMLEADAKGAQLDIADSELNKALAGFYGRAMTKEEYRRMWRDTLQFPSAREFESCMRDQLLIGRWLELKKDEASIVTADDVYLRWRADNEAFDFEALVFPDEPVESMADPDAAALQALWDGMTAPVRAVKYIEPSRQDIVYAWLPMVGGADRVPADKLAALPGPESAEIEARWHQVQADRWPGKTELDDEARAVLGKELKLVQYVGDLLKTFDDLPERTAATFSQAMADAGLTVVNPEGLLGPKELEALPDIGDANLPKFLARKEAGSTHFGYPYGNQKSIYVAFIESTQASRPLGFEEAHEQLVKDWKMDQRGRAARAFRDDLLAKTRALPEAAAAIAPIVEAAKLRAEQQITAKPDLDEAGKDALRKQVLDDSETQEVAPRLAEFESRIWTDLAPPAGVTRLTVTAVPRNYARQPSGTEAADSLERFLKTSGSVFQLAVNAISQPLHHDQSGQTAIVRVTGRSFPPQADMLSNRESMDTSRKQLVAQRQFEVSQTFSSPDALKLSHQLKVTEVDKSLPRTHEQLPDEGE